MISMSPFVPYIHQRVFRQRERLTFSYRRILQEYYSRTWQPAGPAKLSANALFEFSHQQSLHLLNSLF
jgi:hypothetical protein